MKQVTYLDTGTHAGLSVDAVVRSLFLVDFINCFCWLVSVSYCRQIWQNFVNVRADFFSVDNATMIKLKDFYAQQDKWMRSTIKNHPSDENVFWRHVAYIVAQFDGLYAGYRAAALPEWVWWLFMCFHWCCLRMWSRNKINSVLATIYFISAPSIRTCGAEMLKHF